MIGGASAFSLMSLGVVDVYADENPKPSGNIIARGEDGVKWELYENGYLLFKPEVDNDTLGNGASGVSIINVDISQVPSWKRDYGEKIKYVGFTNKVYLPVNSSYLFASHVGEHKLNFKPIFIDTDKVDTSKVVNMFGMFSGSTNLKNLNIRNWDTSNVKNMSEMFSGFEGLKSLDIGNWNTSNVTDMSNMFSNAVDLTNLNIGNWDTRNVKDMRYMFLGHEI